MGFIRRVITGHDNQGRSIVLADGIAPAENMNPLRPGQRSTDVWKTSEMPVRSGREEPDTTLGPRDFVPPMGTKIRIVDVPAETEEMRSLSAERASELFKLAGHSSSSSFGKSKRHPLMHRTESIDYAVVLDGEMTMLLDVGEVQLKTGDVVIQRGTNHAWSNRSGKVVRMMYILIDGRFDEELAELLGGDAKH